MKSAEGGMSSARKGCMESRQRRVCYQSEGEGEYTLARDAILRRAQITYNGLCPLITYQSFGSDKKLSNPIGLLNFLVETTGIEPVTSCMSSMHSNQLSYASATLIIIPYFFLKCKRFSKKVLKIFLSLKSGSDRPLGQLFFGKIQRFC